MDDMVKLYGTCDVLVSKANVIDMTLENTLEVFDKSSTSIAHLYNMHKKDNNDIVKILFNGTVFEAITLDDALEMMCKDILFTKYVMFRTLCAKLPACERKYDPECEDEPEPKGTKTPKYKCKNIAECENNCTEKCLRKCSYDCDINCTDECRRKRVVDDDPECEPECTLNCEDECESGYIKTRMYINILLRMCSILKIKVNGIQNRAESKADTLIAAKNLLTFADPLPISGNTSSLKMTQPTSKAYKKISYNKLKFKK